MRHSLQSTAVRFLAALLILLSSAACGAAFGPNAVTPTAVVTIAIPATDLPTTEALASSTPPAAETAAPADTAVSTDTQVPADTAVPAATEVLAATPAAAETDQPPASAALGQAGISGWCLPQDVSVSRLQTPLDPPSQSHIGQVVDGALEMPNLPVSACVFLYTFDQPAQTGLTLQVYEMRGAAPWLTADLTPVEGRPEMLAATLTHTYITAPPLYDVNYYFVVADASGQELRRDQVNMHRWKPPLCWNGRLPNPITLRCPLPQDLHPWDAGYGTPIPTFPPEDD